MNGMHLIPLDQDKEPTCGRGFLDEANYEQNTQKVIPGEMYGVLTGRSNRVLVVDWDCYGGKCEFELTEEMLTRKVGGEGATHATSSCVRVNVRGRRPLKGSHSSAAPRSMESYAFIVADASRSELPTRSLGGVSELPTPRRNQT